MERKSTILDKMGNKNPFTVPQNYFEDFAAEMDLRISAKQTTLKKLIKPWVYMAAMFIGLFLIGNLFYAIYHHNKTKQADLYEIYVMSQMDQSVLFDYYVIETSEEEQSSE
ncbi:MAG: hypothetical protein PHQ11_05265 [Paludibacter sp.]|nr:hypothetical protein [Paludibacter sp.]MDD4199687.1 hypothetical protein [Paludibacter sp.]MDD4428706.1 hypothetical protein [Paludibacter sp.]